MTESVPKTPADFAFNRYHVDLGAGSVRKERVQCEDLDDVLGGIARGFKLFDGKTSDDAYAPGETPRMVVRTRTRLRRAVAR